MRHHPDRAERHGAARHGKGLRAVPGGRHAVPPVGVQQPGSRRVTRRPERRDQRHRRDRAGRGSGRGDRRRRRQSGAGGRRGAGAGLFGGSAVGANAAYASGTAVQYRYDIAYQQCMYAKGNQIPVGLGRRVPGSQTSTWRPPPPPPPGYAPATSAPALPSSATVLLRAAASAAPAYAPPLQATAVRGSAAGAAEAAGAPLARRQGRHSISSTLPTGWITS